MADAINDGGPAFLFEYSNENGVRFTNSGLSLRDWFAGQAMQALIAKSPFLAEPQDFVVHQKTSLGAYEYADAMLKARTEGAQS